MKTKNKVKPQIGFYEIRIDIKKAKKLAKEAMGGKFYVLSDWADASSRTLKMLEEKLKDVE